MLIPAKPSHSSTIANAPIPVTCRQGRVRSGDGVESNMTATLAR